MSKRRYFVHKSGNFEDETAYVMYRGHRSYAVTVVRVERELRSDVQRANEGVWKELTEKQAATILKRKPLTAFIESKVADV